jgi:hypothetical protein
MTIAPAPGATTFATATRTAARLAATLGWSPSVFWAATPAELRAALGLDLVAPSAPAAAADLARLKEAFPDGPAR